MLSIILLTIPHSFCLSQFTQWKSFSTAHGLGAVEVFTIFETSDFDLWFGTSNGTTRYNGQWQNFTIQDGLAGNSVLVIQEDDFGNIWFGTDSGVTKLSGELFITQNILKGKKIQAIGKGKEGGFWFGTPKGAYLFTQLDNSSMNSGIPDDSCLIGNDVRSILVDTQHNTWFGTHNSGIGRLNSAGEWLIFNKNTLKDILASNSITDIFEDQDGEVWFATIGGGVICYNGANFRKVGENTLYKRISAIEQDWEGNFWFTTINNPELGVFKFDGNAKWDIFSIEDGLAHYEVHTLIEDCFRNIWFGTRYAGVSRYDPSWQVFLTANPDDPLYGKNEIRAIEPDGDSLWFGLTGAGAALFDGKDLKIIDHKYKFCYTTAIEKAQDGSIWFGTFGGGVIYIDCNGEWEYIRSPRDHDTCDSAACETMISIEPLKFIPYNIPSDTLADNRIWDILADYRNNALWFATECGGVSLYDRDNKLWVNYNVATTDGGIPNNHVRALYQDKQGFIWAGTETGISRFDIFDSTWQTYNNTLPYDIRCIDEDDKNILWCGTDSCGVLHFNPVNSELEVIATENGLSHNQVNAVAYDRYSKSIWFGTERGVNHLSDGQWKPYTKGSTGLPVNRITSIFVEPFVFESGDNTSKMEHTHIDTTSVLWFGTANGVARFLGTAFPPETSIRGQPGQIFATRTPSFEFWARDNLSAFDEIAYSYTIKKVGSTDGADVTISDWTPFSSENRITVRSALSENGNYEIWVRAKDSDGNIDPTPDKLPFTIDPLLLEEDIGVNGGIITSTSDNKQIEIYIPPGALSQIQKIKLSSLYITDKDVQKLLVSGVQILAGYAVTPVDSAFDGRLMKSGSIKFKDNNLLDKKQNPKNIVLYHKSQTSDSLWTNVGGSIHTGSLTAPMTELGKFVIIKTVRSEKNDPVIADLRCRPRVFSASGSSTFVHTNILFKLGATTQVTIGIYNVAGRLVRKLAIEKDFYAGENAISWNGYDESGNYCVSGLYIVHVVADGKEKLTTVAVANK